MTVLTQPYLWLPAAAAGCGLLLFVLRWAFVMAPRRGTLEWIGRTAPPPWSLPAPTPIRGARLWLPPAAALIGVLTVLCRDGFPALRRPEVLLPATEALLFCAAALTLGSSGLSSLLCAALLCAGNAPGIGELLLIAALWLVFGCGVKSGWLRAVLLFCAAALAAASCLSLTAEGVRFSAPVFSVPSTAPLLAELTLLTALPLLIAACRLHDARFLLAALAALLFLPAALFGAPAAALAAGAAALSLMMTAAAERGAENAPGLLFCLLFACIFITMRRFS